MNNAPIEIALKIPAAYIRVPLCEWGTDRSRNPILKNVPNWLKPITESDLFFLCHEDGAAGYFHIGGDLEKIRRGEALNELLFAPINHHEYHGPNIPIEISVLGYERLPMLPTRVSLDNDISGVYFVRGRHLIKTFQMRWGGEDYSTDDSVLNCTVETTN